MRNFNAPLQAGRFYHIFNHANGFENLFRKDENYRFFMEKYFLHISTVADTYSFCLLPNHFHLLVSIKQESQLKKLQNIDKYESESDFLSKQFSNLFSSYTQSYNKVYNRMGNLFKRPFGRIEINTLEYLRNVVSYIHINPVKHSLCTDMDEWKYSSYNAFFSEKESKLKRKEVIKWFENIENLKYVTDQVVEKYALEMELTY